jgi:hypothetical protein
MFVFDHMAHSVILAGEKLGAAHEWNEQELLSTALKTEPPGSLSYL